MSIVAVLILLALLVVIVMFVLVKYDVMKKELLKKTKFINRSADFGFKKSFFEDPNKDLLIDFLNALFKGRN